MKKLLAVAFAASVIMPSIAMAKGNHPMAGCGLGYVLLSNKDNDKISQILGATTNGTSGNQTFGISSGTSGCTEDGAVKIVKEAEVYAEVNFDTLRAQMASGQGEFVNTFARLVGGQNADVIQLAQVFKSEYTSLFPSAQTTSAELLENLQSVLSNHKDLLS